MNTTHESRRTKTAQAMWNLNGLWRGVAWLLLPREGSYPCLPITLWANEDMTLTSYSERTVLTLEYSGCRRVTLVDSELQTRLHDCITGKSHFSSAFTGRILGMSSGFGINHGGTIPVLPPGGGIRSTCTFYLALSIGGISPCMGVRAYFFWK